MTEDVTVTEKMTSRYHNTSSGGKQSTITPSAVENKSSAGVRIRPQRVRISQTSTGVTETSAGVKPQQPQRQIEP